MISLRLAAACALWLVPAAGAAAGKIRPSARVLVPAGLAVAAAVTAAVLADELQARHGDDMTASCLAALRAHDRIRQQDQLASRRRNGGAPAGLVRSLPGRAAVVG